MCSVFNDKRDILSYETEIWKSCDVVRGHVKESNLPNLMMPFLALVMIESRLVREYISLKEDYEDALSGEELKEEIINEIQANEKGYNSFVIEQDKRLINVCESSLHFEDNFEAYLDAFDAETKELLGIDDSKDLHYLDLRTHIKFLKGKGLLFDFVKAWAAIDLTMFNNSEITTLEEHIKRRWADISASTSGEQYTPSDIIDLISDFALSFSKKAGTFDSLLNLYDMTCGGGNMVYGVEDKLSKSLGDDYSIDSYGQEINDQLYALAKIESRFRGDGKIVLGNTLLDDKLSGIDMDFIAANPPYGVDWGNIQKSILNDKTGRYHNFPSKSDGQLLFVQHAISKLKDTGKAVIVLNGSPMFSGDVNSGESLIRKHLLDNDYVEGWVQLPTNEFFNTGITTYLWILNKDKPAERKDKIILINAAERFVKLKKSKGNKTNEISEMDRQWIVEQFENFEGNDDDVKVLPKWDFYYNKQALTLIEKDEQNRSFYSVSQKPIKVTLEDVVVDGDIISFTDFEATKEGLDKAKEVVSKFGISNQINVNHVTSKIMITYEQIPGEYLASIKVDDQNVGAGQIELKVSLAKQTKNKEAHIKLVAEIKPVLVKDYEIIPYSNEDNESAIQGFLEQWVRKDYVLGENSVGVEVNFNKIFYKPVVLRSTKEIALDIKAIDAELAKLEEELWG